MLEKIFAGGVAGIVSAVGVAGDALFTSKEELGEQALKGRALDIEEAKLRDRGNERQVEVNLQEAKHSSIFVSGWRPGIGWVCGIGLACYFLPQFLVGAIVWSVACYEVLTVAGGAGIVLPEYPVKGDQIMELVIAMLGMGALRTAEKFGKVSRDQIDSLKTKKE